MMNGDRDDKQDALTGPPSEFVGAWLDAIETASEEEKNWRDKEADEASAAYTAEPGSIGERFNIFHSNMETLIPALYNSTPVPDVRRRFNDEDKVSMAVSELLERSLSFSVDDYDFNSTMKAAVKDMAIVDRGLARIRYTPYLGQEGEQEDIVYQTVECEYVPWRSFRRGPARLWKDVPWIAFEHYLSRHEVMKLLRGREDAEAVLAKIPFTYSAASKGDKKTTNEEVPKFGARAHFWEIWDRDTKQVIFICDGYGDGPVKMRPDPLKLSNFFPIPMPMMQIIATDSLVPVTSFRIYRQLLQDLDDVSNRISGLIAQLRVRGGYAGIQDEIEKIANAADGELVPLTSGEVFAQTAGGLDKAVMWWPLEMIYEALRAAVEQREVIKQTIYEVTGLSDILRGATDANETATAQEIKQKWGSIRVQNLQGEVARFARDLFRLKVEVMCRKFTMETFSMMTGITYPSAEEKQAAQQLYEAGQQALEQAQAEIQAAAESGEDPAVLQQAVQQQMAQLEPIKKQLDDVLAKPTIEEIEKILRNPVLRKYKVDIESDSTIRADLTRNQEQMKAFLEGTAAFAKSVGPMVTEGAMPGDVAVTIYSAFARHFSLGKQAEDALEKWATKLRDEGPEKPAPDPKLEAEVGLLQAQAKKTNVEADMLPQQHAAEQEEKRFQRATTMRQADREDKVADHTVRTGQRDLDLREKEGQATRAIEEKKIKQAGDQHHDQLWMERRKLADGKAARREGHQAAFNQATAEGKAAQPIAPLSYEDEEDMTSEERALLQQAAETSGQVAQGLAELARSQEQGLAMLAQAIAGQGEAIRQLSEAVLAPREIVRDKTGRALGMQPRVRRPRNGAPQQ